MSKPTGKLIRVTPEGIGAVPTSSIVQTTGSSTTQVMTQKAVSDELARLGGYMDYALVDFGEVTINKRYVKNNPFGNDVPVITVTEVLNGENKKWGATGWIWGGGGHGTSGGFVAGEGLIVQTGSIYILWGASDAGGLNACTASAVNQTGACRMHVWKLKGGN